MNDFNYKEALNNIKASLFDIYENQEQAIGLEQDPKVREARLNKFIELKDMALLVIEGINYLYDEDLVNQTSVLKNKLENPQIPSEVEESKILNMVQNSNVEDNNEEIEEDTDSIESEDVSEEEQEIEFDIEEENTQEEDFESDELKRYYLTCDMENVNFAYVPQSLYEKIKMYNTDSEDFESETDIENTTDTDEEFDNVEENEVEETDDNLNNLYMKQDTEKPRGIIVRSDQYMKLALSKHRQEGVLQEAREYRIQEVKRKRREEQKRELEKAEVKIDI
ncbi:MAG: hypothetical protein J6A17_02150 [Bacilli bacterium]|nr:hypothetical protein [Bacilli bacterium]